MKILGVSCSHDSGAAIVEDGRILSAVNEERLNRKKTYWGFPVLSLERVFEVSKVSPEEIDYVALANLTPGMGARASYDQPNLRKKLLNMIGRYPSLLKSSLFVQLYRLFYSMLRQGGSVREYMKRQGIDAPLHFIEHHRAHTASAFYTSCFDEDTLILTCDAMGDGYCSTVNTVGDDFGIERVASTTMGNSICYIYSYVTYNLGFIPMRHEGKITGLAAFGNPAKTYPVFQRIMDVKDEQLVTRDIRMGPDGARQLHLLMQHRKIEDIAAGVQKRTEDVCIMLLQNALSRYPRSNVALAGGLFANVKVNQRISENEAVKKVYVHPHMGDGGLAVGSALALWAEKTLERGAKPEPVPIDAVYLGPEYSDEEIVRELENEHLKYECSDSIEREVAELVRDKRVVGRFNGRMEYGPRALGNRSIIADASDRTINDRLNKRLKKRSEFMPFAPSILREFAEEYYVNFLPGEIAAKFMTIAFNVTEEGRNQAPAVCHIDDTSRPQTVEKKQNESYHEILRIYLELTGKPIVLNTSFNVHEEPIVCSPHDAVRSFKLGAVDYLAIGNYLCAPVR